MLQPNSPQNQELIEIRDLHQTPQFNLERFFHLTHDFLCIAGYDGFLRKTNPAFIEMMGYSLEELQSRHVNEFIYLEDREKTSRLRENIKNDIPLLNFENRYVTRDGKIVWLSWTSVREPENKLIYAIAKNITHVKKLEEERNLLLMDLTRLNADLKQFTYTASHDLRAPVNNLIALFGLLDLTKIEDEESLEYLELMKTSALNMKKKLNNSVDAISREEKINVRVEKLNLRECLDATINSIQTLITDSGTRFIIDLNEPAEIEFNPFYLQSIFLNLISNSIKYARTEEQPVIAITSRMQDGKPCLTFSDNGSGFDMKLVEGKIFKLHQSFHNNHDSKGIGLYLVQNHMESLGGSIKVSSEVKKGTTFTLFFGKQQESPALTV